jgi:hypothetical protein
MLPPLLIQPIARSSKKKKEEKNRRRKRQEINEEAVGRGRAHAPPKVRRMRARRESAAATKNEAAKWMTMIRLFQAVYTK